MGIFDIFKSFKEPIFIKTDSELEKKVEELNKLKNQGINNKKLDKDLLLAKAGLQGEKEIEYELKNSNIGMYILHDITLKYKDLSAQIDYIIITAAKIYFVECKNLIGNVTVNENGDFIREYYLNGKKIKEGFYSPIRQAERHVDLFHKRWSLKNKGIFSYNREKNFNLFYVPLVVMANSKNILNLKHAPYDVKNKIIKSDQLIRILKNDIKKMDKDLLTSKSEMEEWAYAFKSADEPNNINYRELYLNEDNNSSQNKIDDIKNKLIEFRKKRSKDMNIPAYYVFTNDELDKLLDILPKTIEELEKSNILSPIKIKTHGIEIIKIING